MRSRPVRRRPPHKPPADGTDAAVYAGHTTRPGEGPGAVEVVFTDECSARAYAQSRSTDHRITSASVTRYVVGQFGARHPVAWYQRGIEQDIRASRPDRRYYPTDHPSPVAETHPHQPPASRPLSSGP